MPLPRAAALIRRTSPALLAALLILPLDWLISTWSEDASNSALLALLTVGGGLLLWRRVGEQHPGSAASQRYALCLLLCGAALRGLAGLPRLQACAGAGLALDAYALAVLAGAQRRPLPPGRVVLLGALWLPTEIVLGRLLSAAAQPIVTP